MGYDGTVAWSQDPSGTTRVGNDEAEAELAANAAYRDQLAFWFPARHAASITYKRRAPADDADCSTSSRSRPTAAASSNCG